jgi:hypothetical protein
MLPTISYSPNRRLMAYASPVFAYWAFVLLDVIRIAFFQPTALRADMPLLAISELLFLASPLCMVLGWVSFARQRRYCNSAVLKPGRNCLILASILTVPIIAMIGILVWILLSHKYPMSIA